MSDNKHWTEIFLTSNTNQMNQPNQPVPNKYSYQSMADELKQYIKDNPDEAKKVWDELCNQPPKSAEEFALRINKFIHEQCINGVPHDIGWNVMKQFARYVTDEEIDAMFPYLLVGSVREQTKWNEMQEMRRIGAKAMRDMIFNNVKLKV